MRGLLYYITDRGQFDGDELARRHALLAKVAEASRAGVDYIQIRERDLTSNELESLTRDVVGRVRENSASTRVLANSRTDIALATDADGVHLRSNDIEPSDVRLALGKQRGDFLVVTSCHSRENMDRAEQNAVDFVVFGPVFGKDSVPGIQPIGLDALRDACRSKLPVFALGGVTLENAHSCLTAGAAGIAGIRIFQENNIEDIVGALRSA